MQLGIWLWKTRGICCTKVVSIIADPWAITRYFPISTGNSRLRSRAEGQILPYHSFDYSADYSADTWSKWPLNAIDSVYIFIGLCRQSCFQTDSFQRSCQESNHRPAGPSNTTDARNENQFRSPDESLQFSTARSIIRPNNHKDRHGTE